MEEQNKPLSADGWIEWKGGKCPVAQDAITEVRLRCGIEWTGDKARVGACWGWYYYDDSETAGDIVAYRVVGQEPAKAEPSMTPTLDKLEAEYEALRSVAAESLERKNAAMIARDGKRSIVEVAAAAMAAWEPATTAKPPIPGLLIERDLNGQVSPRFGSASF